MEGVPFSRPLSITKGTMTTFSPFRAARHSLCICIAASLLALISLRAEEEASEKKHAEITRSLSATVVDDKGATQGSVNLKKGDVYEVVSETFSEATLKLTDKLARVPKDALKIDEAREGEGSIRIVSAKIGFPHDRVYEVKEEVKKKIREQLAKGAISPANPVKIEVTEDLLRAKAKMVTTYTHTYPNGSTAAVRRNGYLSLLITYEYGGKRLEKFAKEKQFISLP